MDTNNDVQAEFKYWASPRTPDLQEAMSLLQGPHPDVQTYTTNVHDLRKSSKSFNLEDNGFQIINHSSAYLPPAYSNFDFKDTEQVGAKYWPELCELVERKLGTRLVIAMNSAVRETSSSNQPFQFVHNDISPVGAWNWLRATRPSFFEDIGCSDKVSGAKQEMFFNLCNEILGAGKQATNESSCTDPSEWDGANYQGPRWGLLSMWRALEPVQQDPLGLMDPSSLFIIPSSYDEKHKSYISIPFPHYDKNGEQEYIAANMLPILPRPGQKHKWYWTSNQQTNEVYAIKLFDSEAWKTGSHVVPCCAHSAFAIPGTQDLPPRKSIETRCIVVW